MDNSTSPDLVITALSGANGNQLNFGETLFGQAIIGAHYRQRAWRFRGQLSRLLAVQP